MFHQFINHTHDTLADFFFWYLQTVVITISFELWQNRTNKFADFELTLTCVEIKLNLGIKELHDNSKVSQSEWK